LEPIQDCKNLANFIEISTKDYNNFDCCHSKLVKCNDSQNSIIELYLSSNLNAETRENFSLETFLIQFPYLNVLDVGDNQLEGQLIIPDNSNLEILSVSNNQLTDVSGNQFEGELIIPENSNLESLNASNNQLTGDLIIPENSKLKSLYVRENQLTGKLIIPQNSNIIDFG